MKKSPKSKSFVPPAPSAQFSLAGSQNKKIRFQHFEGLLSQTQNPGGDSFGVSPIFQGPWSNSHTRKLLSQSYESPENLATIC